jgi:hypothetical protein
MSEFGTSYDEYVKLGEGTGKNKKSFIEVPQE